DVYPTSGDCCLHEKQIRDYARENPGSIGYCPQFDAVDGYLTSREALMCYAKLIGIINREQTVNLTLRKFHLDTFANQTIRTYSGGMRRKLSVALAMLGQPTLILLDEPTNGMDPGNRRVVWNNIIAAKKEDKAILLTSHSMNECDILCSNLAIMVNGQFKCLGSPQHLKHRFGTGYYLKLRLNDVSYIPIASNILNQYLPDSIMTEHHGIKLEYNIPKTNTLSKIFGFIESNKELMGVIDYSLSQTTLEHVFLRFASKQRDNSIINLDDVIVDNNDISINDSSSTTSSSVSYAHNNNAFIDDKFDSRKKASRCSLSSIKTRSDLQLSPLPQEQETLTNEKQTRRIKRTNSLNPLPSASSNDFFNELPVVVNKHHTNEIDLSVDGDHHSLSQSISRHTSSLSEQSVQPAKENGFSI
ncbi:unnamed protein product, partial [Didymodactylos carnosus]